jgi:hypothetical protein
LWGGLAYSAIDTYLLRGKAPWTLRITMPTTKGCKPAGAADRLSQARRQAQLRPAVLGVHQQHQS